MNKIERLEELKDTWKAAEKLSKERGDKNYEMYSKGRVESLTAAIAIINQPSNTQDTPPERCDCYNPKLFYAGTTHVCCAECNKPLPAAMTGKFVTAKLKNRDDARQGWMIRDNPLTIVGNSGRTYICEGAPTIVGNPPPNNIKTPGSLNCGHECHFTGKYGFVPEAGCPVHDVT